MKRQQTFRLAAAALGAALALPAYADTFDVDLSGWLAAGDFGAEGNTEQLVNLDANALITGFSWVGLSFTTHGESWQSDFVLSVNNPGATAWLDWAPSTAETGGTYGPGSGFWNGADGAPGPYGAGEAFQVEDGRLLLTTYLAFDTPPVGAEVLSGNLRIYYQNLGPAVPEPAMQALMALGLAGLALAARRRGYWRTPSA